MNIKLALIRENLPEFEIINFEDIEITGISYDTRTIENGDIFIPIKGENFDGHDFIPQAFNGGAVVSMCDSKHVEDYCDLGKPLIIVDTVEEGLEKIVNLFFTDITAPITAITGSTGKTTTREMLVTILESKGSVLRAQKDSNLNTLWGNAKVLSNYNMEEYIVLEFGMDRPGEIGWQCRAIEPDLGAILNIGYVHASNVGGIEGVFKAKKDLADYLDRTGKPLVVNVDDEWLQRIEKNYNYQLLSYGYKGKDFRLVSSKVSREGTKLVFENSGKSYELLIPVYGKELAYNALAAISLADLLGVEIEDSIKALASFKGFNGRFEIKEINGITIVNDAYNANPTSMSMSVNTFDEIFDKDSYHRIVILGDMKELGDVSSQQHSQLGQLVSSKSFDEVYFIGDFFDDFGVGKRLESWEQTKNIIDNINEDSKQTAILLKASHSIGLFKIFE
jgi:UDP-N-acetylmuramoyl-tripeptide--D-alanyl-D-alanine ligase